MNQAERLRPNPMRLFELAQNEQDIKVLIRDTRFLADVVASTFMRAFPQERQIAVLLLGRNNAFYCSKDGSRLGKIASEESPAGSMKIWLAVELSVSGPGFFERLDEIKLPATPEAVSREVAIQQLGQYTRRQIKEIAGIIDNLAAIDEADYQALSTKNLTSS